MKNIESPKELAITFLCLVFILVYFIFDPGLASFIQLIIEVFIAGYLFSKLSPKSNTAERVASLLGIIVLLIS